MIMDRAKNVKWIIPFKKFGMVRVKIIVMKEKGGGRNRDWLFFITISQLLNLSFFFLTGQFLNRKSRGESVRVKKVLLYLYILRPFSLSPFEIDIL